MRTRSRGPKPRLRNAVDTALRERNVRGGLRRVLEELQRRAPELSYLEMAAEVSERSGVSVSPQNCYRWARDYAAERAVLAAMPSTSGEEAVCSTRV